MPPLPGTVSGASPEDPAPGQTGVSPALQDGPTLSPNGEATYSPRAAGTKSSRNLPPLTDREREIAEELWAEHGLTMYRLARSIVRDDDSAGGIVDHSTVEIARYIASGEKRVRSQKWLLVRNVRRRAIRANQRMRRRTNREVPGAFFDVVGRDGDPASAAAGDDLWTVVETDESLGVIASAIVVMRYQREMTLGAIAKELGLSRDQVKRRLNRALQKLRYRLPPPGTANGMTS